MNLKEFIDAHIADEWEISDAYLTPVSECFLGEKRISGFKFTIIGDVVDKEREAEKRKMFEAINAATKDGVTVSRVNDSEE